MLRLWKAAVSFVPFFEMHVQARSVDELILAPVIPAKAGIHPRLAWMPACAGMTSKKNYAERHVRFHLLRV